MSLLLDWLPTIIILDLNNSSYFYEVNKMFPECCFVTAFNLIVSCCCSPLISNTTSIFLFLFFFYNALSSLRRKENTVMALEYSPSTYQCVKRKNLLVSGEDWCVSEQMSKDWMFLGGYAVEHKRMFSYWPRYANPSSFCKDELTAHHLTLSGSTRELFRYLGYHTGRTVQLITANKLHWTQFSPCAESKMCTTTLF